MKKRLKTWLLGGIGLGLGLIALISGVVIIIVNNANRQPTEIVETITLSQAKAMIVQSLAMPEVVENNRNPMIVFGTSESKFSTVKYCPQNQKHNKITVEMLTCVNLDLEASKDALGGILIDTTDEYQGIRTKTYYGFNDPTYLYYRGNDGEVTVTKLDEESMSTAPSYDMSFNFFSDECFADLYKHDVTRITNDKYVTLQLSYEPLKFIAMLYNKTPAEIHQQYKDDLDLLPEVSRDYYCDAYDRMVNQDFTLTIQFTRDWEMLSLQYECNIPVCSSTPVTTYDFDFSGFDYYDEISMVEIKKSNQNWFVPGWVITHQPR